MGKSHLKAPNELYIIETLTKQNYNIAQNKQLCFYCGIMLL